MTQQTQQRRTIDENTLFIEQYVGIHSGSISSNFFPLPTSKLLQELESTKTFDNLKTTAIFLIFPKK